MNYVIDGQSPIYKQLKDQIIAKVQHGELKAGDKLPTERELALELSIARGTVKKAYEELEKNRIIDIIQGSGSYVRAFNDAEGRLAALRGSFKANTGLSAARVALIDCNIDSLALFKQQMESIPGKTLSVFLLDALKMDDDPETLLRHFDLVITTFSHYDEVAGYLPNFEGKLIKAAVSPSQRTIVEIATIPKDASIGLICRNNQFLNIIKGNLASLLPFNNKIESLFEEDYITMLEALHEVDVVIAAPDSIIFDSKITDNPHKHIIAFHYQIERGSMAYIEDQIAQINSTKAAQSTGGQ